MQRLRQDEPSWFFSGQTTSLLTSVTEKELVRAERGGMFRGGGGAASAQSGGWSEVW